MLDAMKSLLRFSWSMSLFGMRQAANLLNPADGGERTAEALDEVTRAARRQLHGPFDSLYESGDQLQRRMVDRMLGAAPEAARAAAAPPPAPAGPVAGFTPSVATPRPAAPAPAPAVPVQRGRLDTSAFVVLGEGLAAGVGNFGLCEEWQRDSFPSQMARQMGADLPQPLLQAPGIGNLPGFQPLPVRVPAILQTTVFTDFPAETPFRHLAVPGLTAAEACDLRPIPPLVHRHDAKQTAVNLILGTPSLLRGDAASPTQLEAALAAAPSFALVALGYAEAVEAAARGDAGRLPEAATWSARLERLAGELRRAGAEVVLCTVPDPLDTAHFSPLDAAARVLKVAPSALAERFGLQAADHVTLAGLTELAYQLLGGEPRPLPAGCVLDAWTAERIRARVAEWNAEVAVVAARHGALVHDLAALFRTVRTAGIEAGPRRLTADFLGGFYTLNGLYPGRTGHALIANGILRQLNQHFGADFPLVDVGRLAAEDSVAHFQAPASEALRELPPLPPGGLAAAAPGPEPARPAPSATGGKCREHAGDGGATDDAPLAPVEHVPPRGRLTLPPGLEQVLPVSYAASYHGDAIRIVDCRDERDAKWGSGGDLFFGGHVMYDSHLRGQIRIRFSPPEGDVTRFEISHEGGLAADDAVLAAPWFFRWPVRQAQVVDVPGFVSSGKLNLATGEVTELNYVVSYRNSALFGLLKVNPHFPQVPITFPGQYGSADARFEQRPDGLLDFSFYGSTFLPLGKELGGVGTRWALPFASGDLQFASLPAAGMVMHPHLHISTKDPAPGCGCSVPEIPTNTVQEFTLFAHNSSFGDKFTLNSPELDGGAKGRSQVMGRVEIQFGERFGDSVPVLVSCMGPGGLLHPFTAEPLTADFPGRLYPGPIGHDEFLRFPLRKYFLDSVTFIDDPFDVSVGAVDLRTGRLHADLLHRGLIGQNLFYALVRVEPRTPKSSFFFRGPAVFEKGAGGETVFRYQAIVQVPYPPGFLFPAPDLTDGITIGPGSVLDPFLWVQAMHGEEDPDALLEGEARRVTASTGDPFSYSFSIPGDPARRRPFFEYTNHAQGATFRLQSLSWVSFTNSRGARSRPGAHDTVTFAGFGTWSKDGGRLLHQVTAQISTSETAPYVSIQIDAGSVSNVNTKPMDEAKALP